MVARLTTWRASLATHGVEERDRHCGLGIVRAVRTIFRETRGNIFEAMAW